MERILHYVWKYRLFPQHDLTTTSGQTVEVVDTGILNTHAGPDFFNAKVKIDNVMWVGNIEIHERSSDWKRHGHHRDLSYDSVVLHLAEKVDEEICRSNGEIIPQMVFHCPDHVRSRYNDLRRAELRPRCFAILPQLPTLMVHSWLTALQTERLQQKTEQIMQRLKRLNNHWEDAFFITLARNFGFGVNGDAFEAWAGTLSLRAVDKHRDDLRQIEAIFFGQAGMLAADIKEDEYYQALRKEFIYLSAKFGLAAMDAVRWKLLRMRPDNFPYVKLAQLAYLYHHAQGLFSKVLAAETIDEVKELFSISTSEYWKTHYTFGKTSVEKDKTLGKGALHLIVINTVSPFLYAYGLHKSDERLCRRAILFLEALKSENNYITRMWHGAGIPVNSAADSQALVQLQKSYCDLRKCLHCRFGYEYLRCKHNK